MTSSKQLSRSASGSGSREVDCTRPLSTEFLAKHRGRKITQRLDAVYVSEDSRVDSATRRMQKRSLSTKSW
jgi:hypothetical protein